MGRTEHSVDHQSSSIAQVESEARAHTLVEELEAQEAKVGTLKEALEEEVEELADEAEHLKDRVDEVEPPQGSLHDDELMMDIAALKAELADAKAARVAMQWGPTKQRPNQETKEDAQRTGGKQEREEKEDNAGATASEVHAEATAGV